MKSFLRGSLFGLLAIGGGVLGTLLDNTSVGRLVESKAERSAVIGAACLGQNNPLIWICNGGINSGCAGCGCVMEHEANNTDMGYAAPSVDCDTDPACKYNFRRGSCTGG